jgi:hypothetical protein
MVLLGHGRLHLAARAVREGSPREASSLGPTTALGLRTAGRILPEFQGVSLRCWAWAFATTLDSVRPLKKGSRFSR